MSGRYRSVQGPTQHYDPLGKLVDNNTWIGKDDINVPIQIQTFTSFLNDISKHNYFAHGSTQKHEPTNIHDRENNIKLKFRDHDIFGGIICFQ